mmetsp:Transcript_112920/g.269063  ORF Transcript_112920/g.269063 Transcript_112920/m.269063 type:complete len:229 (-) Transcript_112920:461-1147(-)
MGLCIHLPLEGRYHSVQRRGEDQKLREHVPLGDLVHAHRQAQPAQDRHHRQDRAHHGPNQQQVFPHGNFLEDQKDPPAIERVVQLSSADGQEDTQERARSKDGGDAQDQRVHVLALGPVLVEKLRARPEVQNAAENEAGGVQQALTHHFEGTRHLQPLVILLADIPEVIHGMHKKHLRDKPYKGTGCGHQFHHQNRLQHLIEDKAPVVQHLHPWLGNDEAEQVPWPRW